MKPHPVGVRDRIIDQAISARTLPEIEQATRDLRTYILAHPEDRTIADVGEPLALRRMSLEQEGRQAKAL